MSLPIPNAKKQYFDQLGTPLAGGQVFFYIPGTTTFVNTYQDRGLTILNSNPIVLDGAGRCVAWIGDETSVREVVHDFLGNTISDQVTCVADGSIRANLASTTPGQGISIVGWPTGYGVTQTPTNQFFAQNGAGINRFNDRSFFGGATAADGFYPQVGNDWLSVFYTANGYPTGYTAVGQVMMENSDSPSSGETLVCAAHSLHFTSQFTSPIAVTAVGVNDNTTLATDAWGIYAEGHHVSPTAVSTYSCELGIRSTIAAGAANPYFLGATGALQLEAGAGVTAVGQQPASVYIQMANGTMEAQTGINFMAQSITGTNGVTGTGTAIAFAKGHAMQWYATGGLVTSAIVGQGTTSINAVQLQLTDGQAIFQSRTNGHFSHVFTVNDANVNYLNFFGATTGSAVAISAGGTDPNVDIKLSPQAGGVIQIGNAASMSANGSAATALTSVGPAGAHATVQEWLTIKNSSGVVRYIPCF